MSQRQLSHTFRISLGIYLLFGSLGLVGCGGGGDTPPLGLVSGKITFDDQPLDDAEVIFQPADGRASVGKTNSSGLYSLAYTMEAKGARIGSHKVTITSARNASGGEGPETPLAERKELLPAKYHSKSELTAEVKSGSNTINFDLKSK
jgi:hypothetical protein